MLYRALEIGQLGGGGFAVRVPARHRAPAVGDSLDEHVVGAGQLVIVADLALHGVADLLRGSIEAALLDLVAGRCRAEHLAGRRGRRRGAFLPPRRKPGEAADHSARATPRPTPSNRWAGEVRAWPTWWPARNDR